MKDRLNSKKESTNTNVEFGNEFGDINAAKLYEYSFMNQDKKKKNPKKEK